MRIIIFVSLFVSTALALPVKNSFVVSKSGLVLRGAAPIGKADDLKAAGVKQVLIFKNEVKDEVAKEKAELIEAGFQKKNIHHIPMEWKNIDIAKACLQTVAALQILAKAEASKQKIFFHCTAGEDRTGMLAGLYRMLTEGISRNEAFKKELCARGYSNGNFGKPRQVVSDIEKGLTPLFMSLAAKIERNHIEVETLSTALCKNTELMIVEPIEKCGK